MFRSTSGVREAPPNPSLESGLSTAGRSARTLGVVKAHLEPLHMLRRRSWPWIALAPVFWIMAAFSTVESNVAYWVQFWAFTIYSILSAGVGLAGVLGRPWAAPGLLVLACIGAAYFIGAALVGVGYGIWGSMQRGHLAPFGLSVLFAVAASLPGLLFVRSASNLRSLVKQLA